LNIHLAGLAKEGKFIGPEIRGIASIIETTGTIRDTSTNRGEPDE